MSLLIENKTIKDIPNLVKLHKKIEISRLKPCPYWIARNFNLSLRKPAQWLLKRFIDLSGSLLGLLIFSPLLIATALAIKLDSRGPVLFKQKRIGLYGKQFYMYKFRSMKLDAEKKLSLIKDYNETNEVMFKMENDPRITKVGKLIRKYSLDEFPQLINVIKGEMSLVGPRPPLPEEVDNYQDWHYVRFASTPGLTGIWQISGRAEIKDFDTVVAMDYKYINNWNVLLDLYLILKTVPIVISAKGAG